MRRPSRVRAGPSPGRGRLPRSPWRSAARRRCAPARMTTIRSVEAEQLGELGGDHEDGDAGLRPAPRSAGRSRALAPTSMPRVGSSRIRMRGSRASQRASTTFCWLPPESLRTSCSIEIGVRIAQPSASAPTPAGSLRRDRRSPSRETFSGTHKETLSRTLRNSSSASCLRSSGTRPMPARMASAGAPQRQRPAEDADLAAAAAGRCRRRRVRARCGRHPPGRRGRRSRRRGRVKRAVAGPSPW